MLHAGAGVIAAARGWYDVSLCVLAVALGAKIAELCLDHKEKPWTVAVLYAIVSAAILFRCGSRAPTHLKCTAGSYPFPRIYPVRAQACSHALACIAGQQT